MLGKNIKNWVAKQINVRQEKYGLTDRSKLELNRWNSKTAWIKMASSVNVDEDSTWMKTSLVGDNKGTKIPKKYVLFNGTSEFTSKDKPLNQREGIQDQGAYDTLDKDFGIVPMPGITSLDIKSKTNGMIKIANVTILANSRQQFEIINVLFLRLGFNVLIEYGWSFFYDNNGDGFKPFGTLIEREWFNSSNDGKTFKYWLPKIQEKKESLVGNYGAIFGRVMNYDWSFERDGSYKINLKIITHGDIAESLKSKPSTGSNSKFNSIPISIYFNDMIKEDKELRKGLTNGNEPNINPEDFKLQVDELTEVDADGDGETDKVEFSLSPSQNRDKLSEHLYHLQLMGCGLNNFIINSTEADLSKLKSDVKSSFILDPSKIKDNDIFQAIGATLPAKGDTGYKDLGALGFTFYSDPDLKKERLESDAWKSLDGDLNDITFNPDAFFLNFSHGPISEDESSEAFNPLDQPVYVRLEYLLYYIQTYCLNRDDKGDALVNIDYLTPSPFYVPKKTKCVLSYNPSKYIINNDTHGWDYLRFNNPKGFFGFVRTWNNWMDKFERQELLTNKGVLHTTDDDNSELFINARPCIRTLEDGTRFGIINNVYCNISNILSQIPLEANDSNEMNISIFKLLEIICNEINFALGGVNNLEPVVDEVTNTIQIIDSTNFPNKDKIFEKCGLKNEEPEEYLLQLYGYRNFNGKTVSNFVRNIDLKTTIPKSMASMIAIGATFSGIAPGENATAFSKINQGTHDRFGVKLEGGKEEYSPQDDISRDIQKIITDTGGTEENPIAEGTGRLSFLGVNEPGGYAAFPKENNFNFLNLDPAIESHNTNTLNQFYKEQEGMISFVETDSGGNPSMGFLPFRMSITLDGIDGINIYEGLKLDSSFLPSAYPESMEFVIMGIDHSFPRNDWTTTIRLSSLPKQTSKDLPISKEPGDFSSKGGKIKTAPGGGSGGSGGNGGVLRNDDITTIPATSTPVYSYDQLKKVVEKRFGIGGKGYWDDGNRRANIISVNKWYPDMANTYQQGGKYNAFYDDLVIIAYKDKDGQKGVQTYLSNNKPSYTTGGTAAFKGYKGRIPGFQGEAFRRSAYYAGSYQPGGEGTPHYPAMVTHSNPVSQKNSSTSITGYNIYRMWRTNAQWSSNLFKMSASQRKAYTDKGWPTPPANEAFKIYGGVKDTTKSNSAMLIHRGSTKGTSNNAKAAGGFSAGCNVLGGPSNTMGNFKKFITNFERTNSNGMKGYNQATILSKWFPLYS